MRWRRQIVVGVVCMAVLTCVPAFADYSGSLTSADGGLDGQEAWVQDPHSTLTWSVVWSELDNAWQYDYTFSVPQYAISHMIIEVSDDFTLDDIWQVEGEHTNLEPPDTYTEQEGNPSMPGFIYGIKMDGYASEDDVLVANLSFLSRRNPVWSDFYAKCGGGAVQNAAWNAGLTSFEDDDPTVGPSNESVDNHILAPNGYVPEPATTALFALGLAGLVGAKLRRRRED